MKEKFLEELTSFMQNKGFVWGPSPEIYGGVSGFYTYGPLGKLLKNKIENSVRKIFQAHGLWELEAPTVLPDIVWEASGHLHTFKDKIVICSKCVARFRADKIIEEKFDVAASSFSDKELLDFIKKNKIKCPNCKSDFNDEIKAESLMMKTTVAGKPASLRPETATVTYLPFKNYYKFFREKLPIGVFQIGKAYRNEISPRQHILRCREFTQAEGQILIDPNEKNNWAKYEEIKKEQLPMWSEHDQKKEHSPKMMSVEDALTNKLVKSKAYAWCVWLAYHQFISMGVPAERIRLRQHHEDEKAFYADDAWDIEINTNSFGWVEACGVHDRTNYDLTQHGKFSKQALEARRENGEMFVPHILEIAFGIDRPLFILLDLFYRKVEKEEGKTRFALPYHMSPVDISIFPLMKKPELVKIASDVKEILERDLVIEYDEAGSIGRRYLRSAESGTPYAITVDYESVEKGTVTIRDRDSEKQIRIPIKNLHEKIHEILDGFVKFGDAGKLIN